MDEMQDTLVFGLQIFPDVEPNQNKIAPNAKEI
jgi:hypothetical protein